MLQNLWNSELYLWYPGEYMQLWRSIRRHRWNSLSDTPYFRFKGSIDACSMSEDINGDNEVPVCVDLDDDHWEDDFMESLTQQETTPAEEDSNLEPKIKDFKEAVQTLEDMLNFLESHNCLEMAMKVCFRSNFYSSLSSLHNAANNAYIFFPQKLGHHMNLTLIMMFSICQILFSTYYTIHHLNNL